MKFICMVNPVSGRGKARMVAQSLERGLRKRQHQVKIVETHPDSATFRERCRAIEEDDRVICIGGDGTLLYFLNHADKFRDVAFYGMGTANVISIEYQIPRNVDAFVDMLLRGNTLVVRPGILQDGTRFLMMASLGMDAFILSRVSQRLKNRIGKAAFIPPTLQALSGYKNPTVKVTLDGGSTVELVYVSICRFKHYGGDRVLAPEADACSDRFQVVGIKRGGLFAALGFLWRLWRNKPLSSNNMFSEMAHEVTVAGEVPAQLDGDYFEKGVTEVKVCTRGFILVVP